MNRNGTVYVRDGKYLRYSTRETHTGRHTSIDWVEDLQTATVFHHLFLREAETQGAEKLEVVVSRVVSIKGAPNEALNEALNEVPKGDTANYVMSYGYAPGDYSIVCHRCKCEVSGVAKRAITCRTCSEEMARQGVYYVSVLKGERLAPTDRDKVCTMNCGPHLGDTRTEEERKEQCPDCYQEGESSETV